MKNYKFKFFVFIASITLGFLIVVNVGMGKNIGIFNLNAVQYKDATEERNKLYDEIANLKDENYNLYEKISSYNVDENGHEKIIEHMKSQLNDYSTVAGINMVSGPGIILTINDADFDVYTNSEFEVSRSILHASDVALVLNELRIAGAEALGLNSYKIVNIEVNDEFDKIIKINELSREAYRIINTTGVECAWAFIELDDKTKKIEGPFAFYAIGDPEQLEASLLAQGSHINNLIIRNLDISIVKVDKIILPKSIYSIAPTYMQRADS